MFKNSQEIIVKDIFEKLNSIIDILIKNIDNGVDKPISVENMLNSYSLIYNICSYKSTYDYVENFLEMYVLTLKNFKKNKNKDIDFTEKYNKLSKYMTKIFRYLNKYFIPTYSLPTLEAISDSILLDENKKIFYPEYKYTIYGNIYYKKLKILEKL